MNARMALAAVTLIFSFSSSQSCAESIPGLVSTGHGLTDNQIDFNYAFSRVQGTATGTGGFGVVTTNSEYPISTSEWMPNTETSSWLAPSSNQGQSYDQRTGVNGVYNWVLKFDLSGKASDTAEFSLRWLSDDIGKLYFNGIRITGGDSGWQAFSVHDGFVAGVNELRFEVVNVLSRNTNPTAVRVEFLSSSISLVPEPSLSALFLVGLGIVVAAKRNSATCTTSIHREF